MRYVKHPELQIKRDKSFWARGYYIVTISNITEESIKSTFKAGRRKQKRRK